MENIKEQLIEISSKYVNLHSELNEIESKLQEYTGKKLSPSDFAKIMSD